MLSLAIIIVLASILPIIPVSAADMGTGFKVNPNIPDNQTANKGYFDLRMKPGATQEISVDITNTSDVPIEVTIEAYPGITNSSGTIEYTEITEHDESMKYPFNEIAVVSEPVITIPAQTTFTSTTTIKMPDEEYDGMILGGLVFTKVPEDEEGGGSISLTNVYSYVIGVVLTENDNIVEADIDYVDVYPELAYSQSVIMHKIRNPYPAIADNLSLDIKIYPKGDESPRWTHTRDYFRLAPNTTMEYIQFLEIDDPDIQPGIYTSKVVITQSDTGKTWEFEKEFEVAKNKADDINKESITKEFAPQQQKQGIPTWAIILTIGIGILIVLLIIMLIIMIKNKNKDKTN